MDYQEFLTTKMARPIATGIEPVEAINPQLYPFQYDIVQWALSLGRAALFENVGLGKTPQQLEWAKHISLYTNKPVLILAPLAVADQTVREGSKFGIDVKRVYEQANVGTNGIVITNYDRVHLFEANQFGGVVLDESSILKHYSKTFFALCEQFEKVAYRLCCTATPAPNDFVELGNHSMFLGHMHFKDMLARWFVGEGDIARSARLKKHARTDFWRWLTSWAVCISHPRDLGAQYDMPGFDLPELHITEHRLGAAQASIERAWSQGMLFPDTNPSATGFMKVKRESLSDRVAKTVEIVEGIPESEPVILWCDTDFEADALMLQFPEAVEVRGSQTVKRKEDGLRAFSSGQARMIITKPEIAGFGLNWQHCANAVFVGVSFSLERSYQAIGRSHRYGQTREVNIHLVYAETEGNVMQLLTNKRKAFTEMQHEMSIAMQQHGLFRTKGEGTMYVETTFDKTEGEGWAYYMGDCVPVTRQFPDNSIDLVLHSPPFAQTYIYSDKEADMGNCMTKEEFFTHYHYLIQELLRITQVGRCCAVHVKDLPLFQNRDGVMGIDPFSDDVVAAFRGAGWALQSRITIEKSPVIEMQKTNSHGLLFKNWKERAELLRVGLPDYMLIFQKPGDLPENRVKHDPQDLTYYGDNPPNTGRYLTLPMRGTDNYNTALPIWQEYANPNWSDVTVPLVWSDIDQTDVLNYLVAKGNQDERHICPLQLDLIARVIQWKTNPGDLVLDPFGGIGSTGYEALRMGRRFVGIELKEEYHKLGTKYLQQAEALAGQPTLWEYTENQEAINELE